MSTEGAKTPETQSQTPAGAGAPPTTAPPTPPGETPAAAVTPTPPAAPPTGSAPVTPPKPEPVTLDDAGDDIPEGAELLQLSRNALNKRLERKSKKELKALFGTDNVEEIKAKLQKATEFERTQEEQRRASLSEVERANEDASKWRKKYETLESRVKAQRHTSLITTAHSQVATIAKEFIDPDYLDSELPIFARELQSKYNREEIEKLGDDAIRAYFQKRVETKPKLGKDFGGSQPAGGAPPKADPPAPLLTNGNKENERPTARTEGSGLPVNGEKDFRPNTANSMSSQESKKAAAALGFRW